MRKLIALLMFIATPAFAQEETPPSPIVTAQLLVHAEEIKAGEPVAAGVLFTMPEGWHIYYKDPGDSGIPTSLAWTLPEGISAGEIDWPPYERIETDGLFNNGYGNKVVLSTLLTPTRDNVSGTITVKAEWLACKDICIPESATLTSPLPIANPQAQVLLSNARQNLLNGNEVAPAAVHSDRPSLTVMAAVLFAFLGGIILNLMPCVLPILSLKALALAKKSGAEARAAKVQGIAYTAGVIATFVAIAGVMLALKAGGAAIGWGFQLQQPEVIAALFFLMILVSLNLFGLFELPVLFGNATANSHSARGAFLTGALAVALATPCTAPFMAPALGATLTFSAVATLLVFIALGLGMALPFLIISLFPAARRTLPKPGAWMGRFKQFLAFPMLATAAWLLWVLSRTTGDAGLVMALTGALLVAWLIWWAHGTRDRSLRKVLLIVAALVIIWSVMMQPSPGGVTMNDRAIAFDHGKLAELRDQGTPVFIDATADWCITCKINERIALRDDDIEALFIKKGVVLMVADWTHRDPAITEYLAGFGRNGVPLYVYYPPNAEPVVLPQLITPGIVRDAIANRP